MRFVETEDARILTRMSEMLKKSAFGQLSQEQAEAYLDVPKREVLVVAAGDDGYDIWVRKCRVRSLAKGLTESMAVALRIPSNQLTRIVYTVQFNRWRHTDQGPWPRGLREWEFSNLDEVWRFLWSLHSRG